MIMEEEMMEGMQETAVDGGEMVEAGEETVEDVEEMVVVEEIVEVVEVVEIDIINLYINIT